ncbi:MAG: hypothetical protein ACFWUE_08345 [Xylanivirga thermophila]|uniref:CRISPR-associated protein Csx11 n=1 Tax=Xylanivirga thermophila TaxID=2496273 RepID=UPI0039F4CE86
MEGDKVHKINLERLRENRTEIIKVEIGSLLFNLGKTHEKLDIWKDYFDVDSEKFREQYGYYFSKYEGYFSKIKDSPKDSIKEEYNDKTPFEIDLFKIDEKFKDFFYETDVKVPFENGKVESLKIIDILKGKNSDEEFIKKVMMRGCEGVNSGIDKGAPKEQLDTSLYISNAFGTFKEKVDESNFDKYRLCFLKRMWWKVQIFGKDLNDLDYKEWLELRKYVFEEIQDWYSHLLSDSRFPANDVTLWDQVYMTVSLFKATLAAMYLDSTKYDEYMHNPSSIKWSILGVQYDKLGLAEKAMNPSFINWYRNETYEVDEKIKKVIEDDFVLGNEIYRDETGIYFIVPENICSSQMEENNLYKLNEELESIQEEIVNCFETLEGEAFPAIFLTKPSRGTMNLAYLLENAEDNFLRPIFPKAYKFKETDNEVDEFKVLCDVCRIRLAEKDEKEDLNLCSICKNRRNKDVYDKLNNPNGETIWTGELQDKNNRMALVTMKFELDEWLNGDMLNTMLINGKGTEKFHWSSWDEEERNIEELLEKIKCTYSIPEEDFDGKKNFRLRKYKYFGEDKKIKELIDNFLLFFDEGGIKVPYDGVMRYFDKTPPQYKKIRIYTTFDSYFYPFLDEIKSDKTDDIFVDDVERDDKYKLSTINHRFERKGKKLDDKTEKDWGTEFAVTAKGVFSFAYITEQIKSMILERTIGDRWENMIKASLEDKVDFENRKIKWDELNDDQIEILSSILLQFLIRKNPSPARLKRVWETTDEFFVDMENRMTDKLKEHDWRCKRIKINRENFESIEDQLPKNSEFEYRGLNFISDNVGNLYLISSIEKAIPVLKNKAIKDDEEIKEIHSKISNGESDWIKDNLEMIDVISKNKYKIKLKSNKQGHVELKYITYKPYLSIINSTPISWQFIIPAEYAPELIKEVQEKYDEEFKYVKGKLPLHVGVVLQDYKKPLYIGIKALRNIRRDIDNWSSIEEILSGTDLEHMLNTTIEKKNIEVENSTRLKNVYSLYPLVNNGKDKKGDYKFTINPQNPQENSTWLKSIEGLGEGDNFRIYLNTFDFEFLDVNTRRNDISYSDEYAKRILELKKCRPYTWEEWESFDNFKDYFNNDKKKTKLQNTVSLIYSKLSEWENDDESIENFMYSAFTNIFELKKDINSANKFAKLFGKETWDEVKNMDKECFKRMLYRYLDMYDFWHNGLKII